MLSKRISTPLRALVAFTVLVTGAVSGFAQTTPAHANGTSVDAPSSTMEKVEKTAIVNRINDIVEKTAFVPGIDFTKWPQFLSAQQADIDKAQTTHEFSQAINK